MKGVWKERREIHCRRVGHGWIIGAEQYHGLGNRRQEDSSKTLLSPIRLVYFFTQLQTPLHRHARTSHHLPFPAPGFSQICLTWSQTKLSLLLHTPSPHYYYYPSSHLLYRVLWGRRKKVTNADRNLPTSNPYPTPIKNFVLNTPYPSILSTSQNTCLLHLSPCLESPPSIRAIDYINRSKSHLFFFH